MTTDKPILFSGPMVRAILAGKKSQTRRVARFVPIHWANLGFSGLTPDFIAPGVCVLSARGIGGGWSERTKRLQTYAQGQRLWVRETWQYHDWTEDGEPAVKYAADNAIAWPDTPESAAEELMDVWESLSGTAYYDLHKRAGDQQWRPSIFMPRWASRLTLTITGVRVQRLRDISEDDAEAEGVDAVSLADLPRQATWSRKQDFAQLWQSINGKRQGCTWNDNPWVVAITFQPELRNIDAPAGHVGDGAAACGQPEREQEGTSAAQAGARQRGCGWATEAQTKTREASP